MISPTTKIIAISTGVVGITAGAGVVVYKIINSSKEEENQTPITPKPNPKVTIASLLDKANKRLLSKTTDGNDKWKPKWTEFKGKYTENNIPKEPWIFENWTQDKVSVEAPQKFKELCTTNGGQSVDDEKDSLFVAVRDYCTTEKGK